MRYLLLSSMLILMACTTSKKISQQSTGNKIPVFQWDTITTFKANITVLNRDYTGMMILNRENDSSYRVILTTGVGPKLIDMSITSKGYTKLYAIKQLNRKALLNMLWEDFGTMVNIFAKNELLPTSSETVCFPVRKKLTACYNFETKQLSPSSAYFMEGSDMKTKISYFYDDKNHPDSVVIEHLSFNMSYYFKKLN